MAGASSRFRLTADASGIISSATSALERSRSLFSSANLTIRGSVTTGDDPPKPGTSTPQLRSSGGRFASPAQVQVAEDGDPEYIIPVRKESLAIPLLRSLLSELSAPARESLLPGFPALPAEPVGILPDLSALSASLADVLSAAPAAAGLSVSQSTTNHVEAPVNISVTASGTDAESLGRSVYDAARRAQLRTLRSVFA